MLNIVFSKEGQEQMFLTSDAYVVHNEPVLTRSSAPLRYVVGNARDTNDPLSDWSVPKSAVEAAVDAWLG
jgi:hypothetical protein